MPAFLFLAPLLASFTSSAIGGGLASMASSIGGGITGALAKMGMGGALAEGVGGVAGKAGKALGVLKSMKQGGGNLAGGSASDELNAVSDIDSGIGEDIDYGSMDRRAPLQGPDLEYGDWSEQQSKMGVGEKLLRSFGSLQGMQGKNAFGVLGEMGNIGKTWGALGESGADYMEPGARDALAENTHKPDFAQSAMTMLGNGQFNNFFGNQDRQKKNHEYDVLRDYYKTVLRRRG